MSQKVTTSSWRPSDRFAVAARRAAAASRRVGGFLAAQIAPLGMLACATLAVATWYRGQDLLWGLDATYPLTLDGVGSYFHVTDDGAGAPDARKLPFVVPVGAVLAAWDALGIPFEVTVLQPVAIVGLLAASGWTSYVLVRTLLAELGRAPAFVGALFYMFNLYVLTIVWSSMAYLVLHYAFLPAVVTLWLVALRRRSPALGVVAALAWTLTLTPGYVSTPVAVTDTALFVGCVVFELVRGGRRARLVATAALTYVAWLALNLFWIVPLALLASGEWQRGLAVGDPSLLIERNSAVLHEAVRLGGYWGLTDRWGVPVESWYYPWHAYYEDVGSALGFAVPAVAAIGVAGLLLARTRRGGLGLARVEGAYVVLFGAVLAAGLFFMTGVHPPLGGVKRWLAAESGLEGPFRSVYQRFGLYVTLAYVPLIALGVAVASRAVGLRLRGARLAVGAVAAFFVAGLPALPMWTGEAFDASGVNASRRITIPDEYRRAAEFLDSYSGDFSVLVLPFGGGEIGVTTLSWNRGREGYVGVEPLGLLTDRPFLTGDDSAPYLRGHAADVAAGGQRALRALRLLNARFVVIHNDRVDVLRNLAGWVGTDVRRIDDRLERLPAIRGVFLAQKLRIYEWTGWRPSRIGVVRAVEGDVQPGFRAGELASCSGSASARGAAAPGGGEAVLQTALAPAPVLARTLPANSCYDGASGVQTVLGRPAYHLRRVGGVARDGWAIDGYGWITEAELTHVHGGGALVPASDGTQLLLGPKHALLDVGYRVRGAGRYEVDEVRRGDVVVLNHPYDRHWRADGEQPVALGPGLTAFRVAEDGPLEITHRVERALPLLFVWTALAGLLAAGSALTLARRARSAA